MIFGGHYYTGKNEGYAYLNDTYVLDVNANKFTVRVELYRNLKYQARHLHPGMRILLSWPALKLLYSVAEERKARYLGICMHWTL